MTIRVGLAILIAAAPGFSQESGMFRGNLAHTGVYNSAGIATQPVVKWRFHTDGRVIASPAIVGRTAYVGSTDGRLYAIDVATGTEHWRFATQARITSSPAVSDGVVYVESYDGSLYAVDAATGTRKWQFATDGERRFAGTHLHGFLPAAEPMPDPFDVFLSSPAVWQRTVYFGSGDGNVYAVDAASGRLKWKFRTGDVVHASPAIADGKVFIGSWDSYFYALNAETGALFFSDQRLEPFYDRMVAIVEQQYTLGAIISSPVLVGGVLYVGSADGNLYALAPA